MTSSATREQPVRFRPPHGMAPTIMGLEAQVITITPEMSYEWLDRKGVNRTIYPSRVERYKKDMVSGDWRLTGEAIKLDKQGRVRDGQHRLWACIEAGVPFTTLVVFGVPDEAFDVMDSGLARTNKDVVSLHGIENAQTAAACARYSLVWDRVGYPTNSGTFAHVSKPDLLAWLDANPDAQRWITEGKRVDRRIAGGQGIWAATLYRLSRVSISDAGTFAELVISGANMQPGHPVLALRNRLMEVSVRRESLSSVDVAAIIVKAWNIWRKGETTDLIYWRRGGSKPEKFPIPQ